MDNIVDLSQRGAQTQRSQQPISAMRYRPRQASGGPSEPQLPESAPQRRGLFVFAIAFLVIASLMLVGTIVGYFAFFSAPDNMVPKIQVEIAEGESVRGIATALANAHVVRSPDAFQWYVRLRGVGSRLQLGYYEFDAPEDLSAIVARLVGGDYGIPQAKVTIPEGYTRKDMAKAFAAALPNFSSDDFMKDTEGKEGYLFPDTYRIFSNATSGAVEARLEDNFDTRTASLKEEVETAGKSWTDVVTVASLVEMEGKNREDRAMIADIIYRRLAQNVPLQLDAPFLYFMNKASLQLTSEDLFAKSPYNTYRNRGLPPTPISSPGMESLDAAVHPTPNDYLYYLSDAKGVVHWAKTFEEHKLNKKLYLGK